MSKYGEDETVYLAEFTGHDAQHVTELLDTSGAGQHVLPASGGPEGRRRLRVYQSQGGPAAEGDLRRSFRAVGKEIWRISYDQ